MLHTCRLMDTWISSERHGVFVKISWTFGSPGLIKLTMYMKWSEELVASVILGILRKAVTFGTILQRIIVCILLYSS